MRTRIVVAVLAALAWPALAQNQTGNQDQSGNQEQASPQDQPGGQTRPGTVERIETPQGTVTIVRPPPRAQPAAPRPRVNPDPVPPSPATPFLGEQLGNECWRRNC